MELRAGDRIDRYTLLRPLGRGGQGSVWQVVDPLDEGSLRALKIVQLADAGQAAFVRARREAKILAHLTHPSLCACYGLFEDLDRGLVGVVLDLVQGRPLDDVVNDGRLDQAKRVSILRQVAEVLAHVHAAGLAHRDLKPANILVTDGFWNRPDLPGTVKLVDFGIAVSIGNPQKLTAVGGVIGTIPYLSPELFDARERAASEESCARDMFAFGVIAYELHFGGHPTGLGHSASFEVMAQRYRELLSGARAWPPRSVPGAWGLVVNACLALRPVDRPHHGGELLDILRTGRMPVRPVHSRTETHTPAPGSLSPNSPRVGNAMTPLTAPMTAPMPMVSPAPPPPPARERPGATSIHGPVYALALAIVALALVIYFKDANKSGHDAEPPPATTIPVVANEACCGGELCKEPQKNIKHTYCEHEKTQCKQCSSGRDYVPEICAKPIDPNRSFMLRLASVKANSLDAKVCFWKATDPPAGAKCVRQRDASDVTAPNRGAAYDERLPITTKDLLEGNLYVQVEEGGHVAARGKTNTSKSLLVSTLCVGLSRKFGEDDNEVKFYLDDP